VEEHGKEGRGVRIADFNIEAAIQTGVHWWEFRSFHPKLWSVERGE